MDFCNLVLFGFVMFWVGLRIAGNAGNGATFVSFGIIKIRVSCEYYDSYNYKCIAKKFFTYCNLTCLDLTLVFWLFLNFDQ